MIGAIATAGDGFATKVTTDDGHEITIDEPASAGGADTGPSPRRLLAASVASCVSITIRMYAERKDWDVSGLEVTTEIDETSPRGEPTPIHTSVTLPEHLDDDQRERILRIAEKCPVHATLEGEVDAPVVLTEVA
jgi:putative redox protein